MNPPPTGPYLALVSVVVRDYDEALRWYVDVLGFECVEDSPVPEGGKRWVVVRPRGTGAAALLLARAATDEQRSRVGQQTGGRVFLFLHTDDFERDHTRLRERGVEFVRGPSNEAFGRVAVFRDLYGNLWDLVEPSRPPRPATELQSATPALPVRSVEASAAFYRDRLGFEVRHLADGFALLARDAVVLHLWAAADEGWRGRSAATPVVTGAESFLAGTGGCHVAVTGLDALHTASQANGILHPNGSLRRMPWGQWQFVVRDPDGNAVTFTEPGGPAGPGR